MYAFEQLIAKFPGLRFMDCGFFESISDSKPVYYNVKSDKIQSAKSDATCEITQTKKYHANVYYKIFSVLHSSVFNIDDLVADIFETPIHTFKKSGPARDKHVKYDDDEEDEEEYEDDCMDDDDDDYEQDDEEYEEKPEEIPIDMQRKQALEKLTGNFEFGKFYVYLIQISDEFEISLQLTGRFSNKRDAEWYVYTSPNHMFIVEPTRVDYFYSFCE